MWLQLFAAFALFQVHILMNHGYGEEGIYYTRWYGYDGRGSPSFSCGETKNISYPFKLQGSNSPGFPLICQNNTTLLINLTRSIYYFSGQLLGSRFQGIYHVKKMNITLDPYSSGTIQIADPNFASNDSASSICLLPRYPIGAVNLFPFETQSPSLVTWVRCRKARGERHLDPATYLPLPCPDNSSSSFSAWGSYLIRNTSMRVAQLDRSCQTVATTLISYDKGDLEGLNLTGISTRLPMGFEINESWLCNFCDDNIDGGCPRCYYYPIPGFKLRRMMRDQLIWLAILGSGVFGIVPRILGILFLAALLTYKLKKKYSSSDNVEKLLEKCQNLLPRRYSYPEIKIITGHFREKLGQGGFGSVFKGILFDGQPVAVKLLGKAKNSGEDFINEVATIGRVHHVNIVRLVGFCSEGRTRALVYEFMPNGSLDKYLFPGNNGRNHLLSRDMLYKIALGIARGIEYLHRGCDVCILHFDIKPHNVLLDENLCPKISDFGLAKLSPTQNSMTLSGYRGTIGYIAPEQVSRNFGGVSCKSDVYSFGMLLLKMAERTRKGDELASGSTSIYFPAWIYDRLSEGREAEIGEATETDEEIMKKLALVGLCCIQMKPANRPSMSQVIEMLEGSLDALHLPPKPLLMLADETSDKECSVLSICQSDMEQVTFYSESKWSASSSRGAI